MSKFTEPLEDGTKHFVVTVTNWGRVRDKVVVASSPSDARYRAIGRPGPGTYVSKVRRARLEDLSVGGSE